MSKKIEMTQPYTTLPRGGYIVESSSGYIQIGLPPETIKDTLFIPRGTPQIFIIPNKSFHVTKGISVAELEFPVYLNFYIRKKKTYIVCTEEQKEQLKIVLQEAVFGPAEVDISSEYIDHEEAFGFPDMKKEMDYFAGGRTLDDLIRFVVFKNDQVRINEVTITKCADGNFSVQDAVWEREIKVPGEVGFHIIYDRGERLPEPYKPPLLGITCLGPSHGFDPEQNTSGFIVWINHQGVMIDPPVNSTEWLRESNVNPRFTNSIILTHCHADHDAGTFQKILEEGMITVYSTETIMHSFIRKYHALTQIPTKELFALFDFVPVTIGRSYMINGGEFRFHYSLHAIPCLSFEFTFEDQSFIYSSDHLNDPDIYKELYEKKILTESRYLDLLDFPWHHKVIYHEAGIPPLHTRVSYLQTLPEEVQKKITVYHIARKDFPTDTHLTLATFGIENTLYPPITAPQHEEVYRVLEALSNVDIFRDFPISKAKEFIGIVEEEEFKRGKLIIQKNTSGDKFYIILSGNVRVAGMESEVKPEDEVTKRYGTFEYFGEASLILDLPRSADIVAETDVTALTITKEKFLSFIRGSDLGQRFVRLHQIRKTGTWELLTNSRFFTGVTSAQKTQLELIMEQKRVQAGEDIIKQGRAFNEAHIIQHGEVEVLKDGRLIETLGRGDLCGEIYQLQKHSPSNLTFRAKTELSVYSLDKSRLIKYIHRNPGVYMRLNYIYGS